MDLAARNSFICCFGFSILAESEEKEGRKMKKRIMVGIILLSVLLLSLLVFGLCGRYDNKYITPCYAAKLGAAWIAPERLNGSFLYLTDGWAYYEGKQLTPDEIEYETPEYRPICGF